MKKLLFALLATASITANAEVFKCISNSTGAIEYRPSPCTSSSMDQAVLKVKPKDAKAEQQAQQKYQVWRAEEEAKEQAKLAAEKEQQADLDKQAKLEKERQDQLYKQAEIDALNRNATAAEQQALAAQQLAGQMQHQNRLNTYNSIYMPQHTYGGGENGLPGSNEMDDPHRRRHGHEGRHERRHRDDIQHQEDTPPQTHQWGGSGK